MNEIYIDNLEAIAVEQIMNGVRLTIGHTVYITPPHIARALSLEIMKHCFFVHQAEVETMVLEQSLELAGHQKDETRIQLSL